jgi:hypothetical protein
VAKVEKTETSIVSSKKRIRKEEEEEEEGVLVENKSTVKRVKIEEEVVVAELGTVATTLAERVKSRRR